MHADPSKWSITEVIDFFKNDAPSFLPDYEKDLRDVAESWCAAVHEHKLNGKRLLKYVDREFIRSQHLGSTVQNIAIEECVDLLRDRHDEPTSQTYSLATPPHKDRSTATSLPQQATKSPPSTTQCLTNNEAIVSEEHDDNPKSKKKRRLVVLETVAPPIAKPVAALPVNNYMPSEPCTLNSIFYGNTQLGAEVEYDTLSARSQLTMLDDCNDKTFKFIAGGISQARSQFVYKHVKRFMLRQKLVRITRNQEKAAYLLPYAPPMSSQPSATVFRKDAQERYIAVRENVQDSGDGVRVSATYQHVPEDEYTHLLLKYPERESEEPLSLLTAEDDATSTISGGFEDSSSLNDEEMAEEGEDEVELQLDKKKALLDDLERSIRSNWKLEKLPRLESTEARRTWNLMKRDKVYRQVFIDASKNRIASLEARLTNMREQFLTSQVLDEREINAIAGSFEPTIEDIMLESWKIDVYGRRVQPEGIISARRKQHNRRSKSVISQTGLPLDPRNRFTPSPQSNTDATDLDDYADTPVPATPIDLPIEDMDIVTHETQHGQQETYVDEDDDFEEMDIDTRVTSDHRLAVPVGEADMNTDARNLPNAVRQAYVDEDDEYFPGVESFIPARKASPVAISSDSSASRAVVKRKNKRKNRTKETAKVDPYVGEPWDLTANLIAQLDLDSLSRKEDRLRLLIKLIHDEGAEFLAALRRSQTCHITEAQEILACCLNALSQGVLIDQSMCDKPEFITQLANLFLAFYFSQHQYFKELPTAEELREAASDRDQSDVFVLRIRSILERSSSMFRQDPRREEIVQISSDEETTKHEKGKRKAKSTVRDASATKTRQAAHARVEQYSQRKLSQNDSPSQSKDRRFIEINPARTDDQPAIHIDRHIAQTIKDYQVTGVQFMWRELTADNDESIKGCLLAHDMGLGKTMQTITVLVALFDAAASGNEAVRKQLPDNLQLSDDVDTYARRLRALIVCPAALLNNWTTELNRWDKKNSLGDIFRLESGQKTAERLQALTEWHDVGGVMLIGYSLYRTMAKRKDGPKQPLANAAELLSNELLTEQKVEELALNTANIAVLDEAQCIKDHTTQTSQAIAQISARSRIALSGTPLSNKVDEIYELISWVAPGYLGSRSEFNRYTAIPIKEGSYKDADPPAKRKAKKRLAVLRADIDPKYLRADITVLQGDLKPKVEYILTVGLSEAQKAAYRRLIVAFNADGVTQELTTISIFTWLNTLSLLMAHPSLFRAKLLSLRKPKAPQPKPSRQASVALSDAVTSNATEAEEEAPVHELYAHGFTEAIAKAVVGDLSDDIDPSLSAKTSLFVEILRNSLRVKDKMLVFSSNLVTLDYLQNLINRMRVSCRRIDGNVNADLRTRLIREFEDDEPGVLLVSTKAGAEGFNIQCANRLVIFDSEFNPSHERQAVGRMYRIGQQKPVFVYRFVAGGTFETNLQNLQLLKISLSDQVVDKKDYNKHASRNVMKWLYNPQEVQQHELSQWVGKDPEGLDPILKAQLQEDGQPGIDRIYAIKTTETLQVDAVDEALNEHEQREVDLEINHARERRRRDRMPALTMR
ncbi:hypothetical protein AMS68_003954 [Peltaster fructicola]|uniref:Helicase C-terminal domain-containing protein n=1 Tax=Peltaster fructicola TaxID=286661 RepID=A0A6H0XUK0_9PEZI|nr:hypothetical protein AMS68_003954 [Peltaster fructicola]